MLHKRFKSAKCKTALKLATSRIKLMKNKKGVQINQMKRDLAQLLETGQDRTARIRVEHVIREEKMIAAYDLIEIYCELIVARLPMIESQKTCPIDLKEAVTSVIFAAPRCSDISELSDIRKQFTAKYGKDFVSAAIELHPDCGVSRMLVEKLSAAAPDLQTKIKVLSAVAKDHNIDWDSTSFEEKESKPQSDLLNGPSSFENASIANVDPPKNQTVHNHEEKQNAPLNFSEQNRKYTQSAQNVTSTDSGESSSSGVTSERMEVRHNWNMKFKDATSAAQAAAESAERAAVAARAAAQFSKQEKIAGHHPTGPHVANSRDEHHPHVSALSGTSGESSLNDKKPKILDPHSKHEKLSSHHPTGSHVANSRDEHHPHVSALSGSSGENSLDDKKAKILDQHIDQSQHDTSQKATNRFDRYNNDSIEDEKLVYNIHTTDGYFEESLPEDQEEPPSSPERESKPELVDRREESIENENTNFFATKTQPTIRSSHSRSHSSTSSDGLDVGKKSVVGNPFAVVDQENPFKEATKASPNVNDESIYDDDDNDNDDGGGPRFDTGFEYDDIEATDSLENAYTWNPKVHTVDKPISQSHIFSESVSFGDRSVESVEPLETDDHEPASFDHSDGPDSETETDLLSMNPEPPSALESSQSSIPRKSRIELSDLVEEEPLFENGDKQSQEPFVDTLEDNNDSLNQGLSFGPLTGGLRNKGVLRYPPLTKSTTIEKSKDESSVSEGQTQTSFNSSLHSRVSRTEDEKPNVSRPFSDSDSDPNEKANKQANTRKVFSPPAAFFDDDSTDSEDEIPKLVPNKARLSTGLSRRTRGSPSARRSKTHVELKHEPEHEPVPKTVVYSEPRAYTRRSKEEDDKQVSEPQQPYSPFKAVEIGQTKSTTSEPRINHSARSKQEAIKIVPESKNRTNEHVSSRITVEPSKPKDARTQNLGSEKLPGENLEKKPGHVHPKLPEYDSLAARLQSLRTDRHS